MIILLFCCLHFFVNYLLANVKFCVKSVSAFGNALLRFNYLVLNSIELTLLS